jgi:hypothetical protein
LEEDTATLLLGLEGVVVAEAALDESSASHTTANTGRPATP